LKSSTDSYLYLLSGAGKTGGVLAQNDDGGSGLNARIVIVLGAGSYTVEATTEAIGVTGSFVVSVDTTTSGDCIDPIAFNFNQPGTWVSTCASDNRTGRYAHFYTFTLTGTQEVTIDLKSSTDSYLYLLSGAGKTGGVLAQNDDGGSGLNARIVIVLGAGSYTVEATTEAIGVTGSFVVKVSAGAPVCTDCQFMINAGLNDAWLNTATNGQGMTITVFPVIKEIFVAWFTFDTERPPEDVTAILGEPGHRWLTAQGSYNKDTAVLTIYLTEGGVFDSAVPAATTDQDGYGTMTIEFSGCNEGLVTYEITSLDISGVIPIERIVLDNVPLCELLNEQEQ
jgi:hypothetical protein